MELEKVDNGYRITCKFASREGKSGSATFFWNGSKLKVLSITDLDYLENLYEEISQYLEKLKGVL